MQFTNFQFKVTSEAQAQQIHAICARYYDAHITSLGYFYDGANEVDAIIRCSCSREQAKQAWEFFLTI